MGSQMESHRDQISHKCDITAGRGMQYRESRRGRKDKEEKRMPDTGVKGRLIWAAMACIPGGTA